MDGLILRYTSVKMRVKIALNNPIFPSDKVLDVINTANTCIDPGPVRKKILDLFFDCCKAEGAILFLPDGKSGFTESLSRNFCEKSDKEFHEYYWRFDPLRLYGREPRDSISQARIMNYDSFITTEYYTDFLKPYGIHYKLVVFLAAEEGLQGKVVLTRPRKGPVFSGKDLNLAGELSTYMAYALIHNTLKNKLITKDIETVSEKHLADNFRLSRREIEVVRHIFKGLQNSEIAELLFVSEITVKKHLQNIYSKMGVKSRTSLINRIISN